METIDSSEVAISKLWEVTSVSPQIQYIYKQVRWMVANYLPLWEEWLTDSVNFVKELDPEFPDNLHMVMLIEDHFDIEIPDEIAEKLVNIDQIVWYIATVKTVK